MFCFRKSVPNVIAGVKQCAQDYKTFFGICWTVKQELRQKVSSCCGNEMERDLD